MAANPYPRQRFPQMAQSRTVTSHLHKLFYLFIATSSYSHVSSEHFGLWMFLLVVLLFLFLILMCFFKIILLLPVLCLFFLSFLLLVLFLFFFLIVLLLDISVTSWLRFSAFSFVLQWPATWILRCSNSVSCCRPRSPNTTASSVPLRQWSTTQWRKIEA